MKVIRSNHIRFADYCFRFVVHFARYQSSIVCKQNVVNEALFQIGFPLLMRGSSLF